ncbi:MAG: hypothetical protein AB7P17_00155 [Nitrospirales bacterium]
MTAPHFKGTSHIFSCICLTILVLAAMTACHPTPRIVTNPVVGAKTQDLQEYIMTARHTTSCTDSTAETVNDTGMERWEVSASGRLEGSSTETTESTLSKPGLWRELRTASMKIGKTIRSIGKQRGSPSTPHDPLLTNTSVVLTIKAHTFHEPVSAKIARLIRETL